MMMSSLPISVILGTIVSNNFDFSPDFLFSWESEHKIISHFNICKTILYLCATFGSI